MLSAGEHPIVAAERLGRASITLTMDTYSRVQPAMQRGAAERLEAILFPENDCSQKAGTL